MTVETRVIIDEGILDSYRVLQDDGQPDVVTEFIDVFLEDLPQRLHRLSNAVAANDLAEIRSGAHALKGSSASIGAVAVSGYCALLEANARAGSSEDAASLFGLLEMEVARATDELQKHRRP